MTQANVKTVETPTAPEVETVEKKAMATTGLDLSLYHLTGVAEDNPFTDEDLAEDVDGIYMRLPRQKFPSGGSLQFEVAGDNPDRPTYTEALEGIVLYHHPANAFWPDGNTSNNTPPTCSSSNAKVGHGTPGGCCAECEHNVFNEDGSGKACKNMHVLYLLQKGQFIPTQINLPPTSLKAFNSFFSFNFAMRRRLGCGSVIRITLVKAVNDAGIEYSQAQFAMVGDLDGEPLAKAISSSKAFKQLLEGMDEQRRAELDQQSYTLDRATDAGIQFAGMEGLIVDGTITPPAAGAEGAYIPHDASSTGLPM